MFLKLFLLLTTIVYYILVNPISYPSKNIYLSHGFKIGIRSVEKKLKNRKFFMHSIFLYLNFWNKYVCICIKVEQNMCCCLADSMKKTWRCSAFDSDYWISERERNFCYTLTFFINEYYVLHKKFHLLQEKCFRGRFVARTYEQIYELQI